MGYRNHQRDELVLRSHTQRHRGARIHGWEVAASRESTKGLGAAGEGGLEIYSEWFFAVTGNHLEGTPRKIERRGDAISHLHARFFPAAKSSCSSTIRASRNTIDNDHALIEKACNAENGEKFQELWEGNWEEH